MDENMKFYLYLDGDCLGVVMMLEDVAMYDDEIVPLVGTMINKQFLSKHEYKIFMPGMIVTCRKFMVAEAEEKSPPLTKLYVDSDDCILFQLYPFENKALYIKMLDKLSADKLPFWVYNEDGSAPSQHSQVEYSSDDPPPEYDYEEQEKVRYLLPDLDNRKACPEDCDHTDSVWQIVQHLNDYHQWSREEIADWLETLDINITFPIGEENGN